MDEFCGEWSLVEELVELFQEGAPVDAVPAVEAEEERAPCLAELTEAAYSITTRLRSSS
jgi:hypothetical protein